MRFINGRFFAIFFRLVALNKLDKNKSKAASGSSDDEDSSKTLTRNKKKTPAKEREETLMDHLTKVKNGENIVEISESDGDSTKSEKKNNTKDNGDDRLFAEANRMAKKRMLDSSESGAGELTILSSNYSHRSQNTSQTGLSIF